MTAYEQTGTARPVRRLRYRAANLLDWVMLGLLLAGIALFILYPIVSVVSTSFFVKGQFTLQYYLDLFTKSNLKLIGNSLWVATLSSSFTTFFAFCIALYAFCSKEKTRRLLQNGLLLTMISPPFVSALAFILLFGRRGIITYGLLGLSVNPYGWHGIVILQTIGNISFATLLLLASFDTVDLKQVLASRDLGANPWQTLWHVVIPLVRPGLLSVIFTLFTMNLADFGTPIVIGGRYKVLATEAYLQVISTANLGKASAISVLMVPTAVVAFYFYRKTLSQSGSLAEGSKSFSGSGYEFELPRSIRCLLLSVVGLFFTVMALKYGNILLSTVSNTATGHIQFTTKYFHDLPRSQMSSYWRSIRYAVLSGVAASFLGILLSYYTHRRRLPGMKGVEFIASLPYIIPGTFFGLGYVAAFSHEPFLLRGTGLIIICNYTFRQISVANKSANAAFSAIDEKLEAAAQDLGASRMEVFFGVILPLLKSTFLTCFITVFTSSMTSVGAIAFLISPGKNVASMELFQSIENGRYGVAAVQAVMIIAVTLGINLFSMYLLNRGRKNQKGGNGRVPEAGSSQEAV
ncbi:ABC transporter permease [Merdimmobilis hominis]|uniref:ABC transporter permease n=1 Tax=Merdimmobilis hominis TaxID=2897707 RepID=UPI0006C7C6AE|nr:iron ABC transporter permease [Merdimmobilis hominis]